MRTTINLDDSLLESASSLTGINEKTALIRSALKALIAQESAKRLADLGGSQPNIDGYTRRQTSTLSRVAEEPTTYKVES